jgi:S1-C subfamily serine protease
MLPLRRSLKFCAAALAALFALFAAASIAAAFDAKQADKSVLRIVMFEMRDGKRQDMYWIGTGFVIDRDYVLTNNHVIDSSSIRKRGGTPDYYVVDGSVKNYRQAQLIWAAPELDLAVIRVPGLSRPAVTISSGSMTEYPDKAHIVWAIGYPGIVADALKSDEGRDAESTITKGVVSKITIGSMDGGQDKKRPVIQHNASINKGNSGGPLFDDCGVVVGVNTFAPYAIFQIAKVDGKDVAHGSPNTGVFFSPHIGNFLEALKTAPQLKGVSVNTSSTVCATAMGEVGGGMPVMGYVAIAVVGLLALGAGVLALRKGTTREVVRMVESYSAYVKRKGRAPSEESMRPRPVSSPPDISSLGKSSGPGAAASAAASGAASMPASKVTPGSWKLSGKGSKGQAIALNFTAEAIAEATGKKEGGLILGRSTSLADVAVDDETVSRRHAKIYATETGLAIEDLKSAYGTQVNGHKLEAFQAVEVKAGDKVTLGGVQLTLGGGR